MALAIFDLEDAPKPSSNQSFANDLVARLKGGFQENGAPVASKTIVLTTDDPTVANSFAETFGGEVEELDVDRGHDHRVVSTSSSVRLLVDSPEALTSRFAMYGQAGLIFATDGQVILEGEDFAGNGVGDAWTTRPKSFEAWKQQAKEGRAPKPDIRLKGRLEGVDFEGYVQYSTTGWSLVRDLPAIEAQLTAAAEKADGQPFAVTLEFREIEIKKGAYAGRTYTRPVITVH